MKIKKAIQWLIAAAVIITGAAVWLRGVMTAKKIKSAVPAPLTEESAYAEPTPDIQNPALSELVTENENGQSVFAISLEDFIDRYNAVYRQRNGSDYLDSENADNWYRYNELSPCFGLESVRHQFTADKTVWPMPTISFYTEDQEEIFEIRMTFDDHGYQERFHQLFKELCICMEKTMLPELTEREAEELFEKLYSEAYANFYGNHAAYGDPVRPPLTAVTVCDRIGMYCFYGAGNIEICFIPLTENAISILKAEKTAFDDFQEAEKSETE